MPVTKLALYLIEIAVRAPSTIDPFAERLLFLDYFFYVVTNISLRV